MGDKFVVWECVVHGVRMYEDGRIDWEHSTDGSFEDPVFDFQIPEEYKRLWEVSK